MKSTYSMLALSVLIFNGALFFPVTCGWLVFFFLVPIYSLALRGVHLGFTQGYFWGALFFSCHWYGFMVMVLERAQGTLRWFAIPLLVIYSALYAGVWFAIASRCARFGPQTRAWLMICWIVTTVAYFWWQTVGLFWIFGGLIGYTLAFPLVPLAAHPQWLVQLPTLGSFAMLALLVFGAWSCALFIQKRRYATFLGSLCAFLPYVCGWFMSPLHYHPDHLNHSAYVEPPPGNHPLDCAQELNRRITMTLEAYADISVIMLPESAYPFSFNKISEAVALIGDVPQDIHVVIGSYDEQESSVANTLFVVSGQHVIASYDKIKAVPCVEYLPFPWSYSRCLRNLFLKNKKEWYPKNKDGVSFYFEHVGYVEPAICSDLFLGISDCLCLAKSSLPILWLVNDSWFLQDTIPELMYLFARYQAIVRQREIFYVSYRFGVWISSTGEVIPLQRLDDVT